MSSAAVLIDTFRVKHKMHRAFSDFKAFLYILIGCRYLEQLIACPQIFLQRRRNCNYCDGLMQPTLYCLFCYKMN